jgi:hypothetical protein
MAVGQQSQLSSTKSKVARLDSGDKQKGARPLVKTISYTREVRTAVPANPSVSKAMGFRGPDSSRAMESEGLNAASMITE